MERVHARARREPGYDSAKPACIAAARDILEKAEVSGEEFPQFRRMRRLLALLME